MLNPQYDSLPADSTRVLAAQQQTTGSAGNDGISKGFTTSFREQIQRGQEALENPHFFCTPCDKEWCDSDNSDEDVEEDELYASGEVRQRRTLAADFSENPHAVVNPYTKDLVICSRTEVPEELLRSFPFITDGQLESGFTYNRHTGEIIDELSSPSRTDVGSLPWSDQGYVRLITTNWWYNTLLIALAIASLNVMGKNANLIFCFCLLGEGYDSPIAVVPRRLVALSILVLEVFQVCVFCKMALREFRMKKNKAKSGDLIFNKNLAAKDRTGPFWALVLFHILEIDVLVKDIVKYAHPFKDKQPFAAFKADGHRCFMFGFRGIHHFHAAHMPRPYSALLTQILIEAILFIFKVLSAIATRNLSYFVMALPGLFIIYIKANDGFKRARHRKHMWQNLQEARLPGGDDMQRSRTSDLPEEEVTRALVKTKVLHFRDVPWDQEELDERTPLVLKMAAMFIMLGVATGFLCHAIDKFF